MEKKKKKTGEGSAAKPLVKEVLPAEKPKSKTRLFWEKYPDGIGWEIVNMRSVLK